jgi:Trypsin-co-occurring domain 2
VLDGLIADIRYVPGTFDDDAVYAELRRTLDEFDDQAPGFSAACWSCVWSVICATLQVGSTSSSEESGMSDEVRIPLASAIEALRGELVDAVRSSENEEIRFALGTVELELQVAVEKKFDGHGGIKFWLISLGGGASRSSGDTQAIKLSLTAMRNTAQGLQSPVLVGSPQTSRPK